MTRKVDKRLEALTHVSQDVRALSHLDEVYRNDKEIVLRAVIFDGLALEHAPESLRGDAEVAVSAVAQNGLALAFVTDELKADDQVVRTAVSRNGEALAFAAEPLRADAEIVLIAVAKDGDALRFADEALRNDRGFILSACSQNGRAIQHISDEMKADKEVVLGAVALSSDAIWYASEALKGDKDVVSLAVSLNSDAMWYASDALKADKKFVLEMVSQRGAALHFAAEALQADREVVICAMRQDINALQFAAQCLKNDRQLFLDACLLDARAFRFAGQELKSDGEFVVGALSVNGWALEFACQMLLAEKTAVPQTLTQDLATTEAWRRSVLTHRVHIGSRLESLLADKALVMRACEQNGGVLQYASEKLKSTAEVAQTAFRQLGIVAVDKEFAADESWQRAIKRDFHYDMCVPDSTAKLLYTDHKFAYSVRDSWVAVVQEDGLLLRQVPPRWKEDKVVCLAAVEQTPEAIIFVSEDLKFDLDILKEAGLLDDEFGEEDGVGLMPVILSIQYRIGASFDGFALNVYRAMKDNAAFDGMMPCNPHLFSSDRTCELCFDESEEGMETMMHRRSSKRSSTRRSSKEQAAALAAAEASGGAAAGPVGQRGSTKTSVATEEDGPECCRGLCGTGEPDSSSCWRYLFRAEQEKANESGGFMVAIIELIEGELSPTLVQRVEEAMAKAVGLKVFHVYEPKTGDKEGTEEVTKLAEEIEEWYKEDRKRNQKREQAQANWIALEKRREEERRLAQEGGLSRGDKLRKMLDADAKRKRRKGRCRPIPFVLRKHIRLLHQLGSAAPKPRPPTPPPDELFG